MTGIQERLDRLESLVEAQQETIQQQRERIDELEAEAISSEPSMPVNRRTVLKAGGLAALLFGGVGTASADAQGQVGTSSDPLKALYTEELNGDITSDTPLTDLTGTGLQIASGSLGIDEIGSDEIATNAVTNSELAGDSVEGPQIAESVVTDTELDSDSVESAQIATDAVGTDEIASDAVTDTELAGNSVTDAQIATNAVTDTELADGTVTASDLATPYSDLATLVGTPVTAGGDLDMGATGAVELNTDDMGSSVYDRPSQGHLFFGMAGDDGAILSGQAGSNGTNDGEFVIRTQDDGTEEIKLQQHNSAGGYPPTTRLRIDETGHTRIDKDLRTESNTVIWDSSNSEIPTARLKNDSVTVSPGNGLTGGGEVSLGGSTTLDIDTGGVGSDEIATNAVTNTELAADSVESAQIASDAVGSSELTYSQFREPTTEVLHGPSTNTVEFGDKYVVDENRSSFLEVNVKIYADNEDTDTNRKGSGLINRNVYDSNDTRKFTYQVKLSKVGLPDGSTANELRFMTVFLEPGDAFEVENFKDPDESNTIKRIRAIIG